MANTLDNLSRRTILKLLAAGTGAWLLGEKFKVNRDRVEAGPGPNTVEVREREYLLQFTRHLHQRETELASEWVRAFNVRYSNESNFVQLMREYYKSKLSNSAELIHDVFYQELITLHATYNILGLHDGGESEVSFETPESDLIRELVKTFQQEPLTSFESILRHTYLFYIVQEFSYRLSGMRGAQTADGELLIYAAKSDPLEVQMAFDMLSRFYSNQQLRAREDMSSSYVTYHEENDYSKVKALIKALSASEGYRTAAVGYISSNGMTHIREYLDKLAPLCAPDFDDEVSMTHIQSALDYFFLTRQDGLNGFHGDNYAPIDDFVFTPENAELWNILAQKQNAGRYNFSDEERRALRATHRRADILYFSILRGSEAHVFYSATRLPDDTFQDRRNKIEEQYQYPLEMICKGWLYKDEFAIRNSYLENGNEDAGLEDPEDIKLETLNALRKVNSQKMRIAISRAERESTPEELDQYLEKLGEFGGQRDVKHMWYLHLIMGELGFLHPAGFKMGNIENLLKLSDVSFRNRFVREYSSIDDKNNLILNAHSEIRADVRNRKRVFLPFNKLDLVNLLDNASKGPKFRIFRKSSMHARFDLSQELPPLTSFAMDIQRDSIKIYVRNPRGNFSVYEINEVGINGKGAIQYDEIPEESFIFPDLS